MAAHYGTVIIPARPRKPRDRAKGENAVQVVERVVLAPLRDRTFFSLAEVNHELAAGRERLNDLPFQKLPGSRRTLFETLEKLALRPLPAERYELAQWRTVRANIDYHCELFRNFYSVPYQLVHEMVEARLTTSTVELFYKGRRVASHMRLWGVGQYSTDPQHMPVAHQKHLEWTPSRLIGWAAENGAHAAALVSALLASKPHPEQGYRACLGVMRLGKRYSAARLDAACARALAAGAVSYRSVKSILETGLDQQPLAVQGAVLTLDAHANVRGPAYYAAGARVVEPTQANGPDGGSDPASHMPQDRCARGGEGAIPPWTGQSPWQRLDRQWRGAHCADDRGGDACSSSTRLIVYARWGYTGWLRRWTPSARNPTFKAWHSRTGWGSWSIRSGRFGRIAGSPGSCRRRSCGIPRPAWKTSIITSRVG
jgi:transposase